jgi:hypothetical protein
VGSLPASSVSASYSLYGLHVRADIPLDAPPFDGTSAPDLEVRRGSDFPAITGEVVCVVDAGPAGTFTGFARATDWVLALDDHYAFTLSKGRRLLEWAVGVGDPALVPDLVARNVMAFYLALGGVPTLHASAVTLDGGGAIAFAGGRGAGKSTLAALLCERGAKLVTDDVLRLELVGDSVCCFSGGFTLRLRDEQLAARFDATPVRTADDRLTLGVAGAVGRHELRAVVFPAVDESATQVELMRVGEREAFLTLLGLPRWFGWRIAGPQRAYFEVAHAIARRVPVHLLPAPLPTDFSDVQEALLDALPTPVR